MRENGQNEKSPVCSPSAQALEWLSALSWCSAETSVLGSPPCIALCLCQAWAQAPWLLPSAWRAAASGPQLSGGVWSGPLWWRSYCRYSWAPSAGLHLPLRELETGMEKWHDLGSPSGGGWGYCGRMKSLLCWLGCRRDGSLWMGSPWGCVGAQWSKLQTWQQDVGPGEGRAKPEGHRSPSGCRCVWRGTACSSPAWCGLAFHYCRDRHGGTVVPAPRWRLPAHPVLYSACPGSLSLCV